MPAAAVIPAPIAYIKVVAVKTLVVEFRTRNKGRSNDLTFDSSPYFWESMLSMLIQDIYFEEIRVFKAGICLNMTA